MTRRDYITIANGFRKALLLLNRFADVDGTGDERIHRVRLEGVTMVMVALCDVLKESNPRFSAQMFRDHIAEVYDSYGNHWDEEHRKRLFEALAKVTLWHEATRRSDG